MALMTRDEWNLEVPAEQQLGIVGGTSRFRPFLSLLLLGCGDPSTTMLEPDAPPVITGCALAANTTATSTVNAGCALLERDTSSCREAREEIGLSGFWLKFSCRVTITMPSAD